MKGVLPSEVTPRWMGVTQKWSGPTKQVDRQR